MCETRTLLWAILVTSISLEIIGAAASHHHSTAEHHRLRDQERIKHEHHQRHRQSLEGQMHHPHQFSNKSSKFVVINSNPVHQYRPNEVAFRGWYNFLTRPTPPATATTTVTTTTAATPKTPFPSLWNYAPKSHQRNNSTTRSGLSPRQGRHVCVENRSASKTILQPVKSNSFGSAPLPSSHCTGNQICDDLRHRRKQSNNNIIYKCCPGWEQMYKHSKGCNRAICDRGCRNGGKCVRPNVCQCPAGWTGQQCQEDINECLNKPCDQSCINTPGSYTCACRSGFHLQEDRTSCKSHDSNHVALEASELNGEDIDFEEIDHRLKKLERSLGPENSHHVMNKHLDRLINRVNQLEQYQYGSEIRLKAMEAQVQHLVKCRQYPHFC